MCGYMIIMHALCPSHKVHVISTVERITWENANSPDWQLVYYLQDGHIEKRKTLQPLGSELEYIEDQSICFTRQP